MNVAAQAVELRDCYVAPMFARACKCRPELGVAVEGVCALPGVDLNELSENLKALRLGKLLQGLALRFNTKT
jgi:hypothetical protein